jgi:two-component system nitrogen regulation sensor histidine kinase NtrY
MPLTSEFDLALRKKKRQRRIRATIVASLSIFLVLTVLEKRVFQMGTVEFPVSGNVLVFALININVILLLLMVFLTMRNLVELVFERRQQVIGATLRTKLVISFVALSLIPTTLLFFIALQFVSTSMDYWFNSAVDSSLEASLALAQEVYHETAGQVRMEGGVIAQALAPASGGPSPLLVASGEVKAELEARLTTFKLTGLTLFAEEGQQLLRVVIPGQEPQALPLLPIDLLRRALGGEQGLTLTQPCAGGELVSSLTPLTRSGQRYVLVASRLLTKGRLQRLELISKGIQGYRQLLLLKQPIKTSLLVMLLIVTLLIIFSAIWFGFYVSGGLTRPMAKLADGIKRVADGELDFVLDKDSSDEMGSLVDSFNRMTRDLLASRLQVGEAHVALQQVNLETEERRRYTEIILQNVTAGVISLDAEGRVLTINKFAEELLKLRGPEIINKNYKSILRLNHLSILENFFVELAESGRASIQRSIKVTVNGETLSLRVNFTKLEEEGHEASAANVKPRTMGTVIVFDNLTEVEKIQRMAAWREVARRIAHEVKNPLTPIQLSAQRLRKRYLERLAAEGEVFDQCTATIIKQVDELKHLVSEFSSFARMPAVKKSVNSLGAMVAECLVLFQEAHKEITWVLIDQGVPPFYFDEEQMKRVLVNLLDNAVAALDGIGRIEVEIRVQLDEGQVVMEVRDNGMGVSDPDKLRLFEPYFSTKKSGTGLGLAIASTVVADHGGYIRVKDNEPRGARFIIELPLLAVG